MLFRSRGDRLLVTIGNLSCAEDREIQLAPVGVDFAGPAEATLLYDDDMHAHNTFEDPERVKPVRTSVDPAKPLTLPKAGILAVSIPAGERLQATCAPGLSSIKC